MAYGGSSGRRLGPIREEQARGRRQGKVESPRLRRRRGAVDVRALVAEANAVVWAWRSGNRVVD
jgi:hypothetical protein